ncbi:MAG: hypothetical protein QS721_15250 [Candidatus Endonucleobacter sp. (ex Gigantidas childressi)]|nr:hypothetical protein [Candidatus Endonucleobacter sp. (ex Gigantidas childressi)]
MSHLVYEFGLYSKHFVDIGRGDLDLGKLEDESDKKAHEEIAKEKEDLIKRIKEILKGDVEEVRVTHSLTDSPACLVVGQNNMGAQMLQIMKAAGQSTPSSKPIFEINTSHPLILKLDQEQDEDSFADLIKIVFDQANLAAGGTLDNPASYVHRLNKLLVEMTG